MIWTFILLQNVVKFRFRKITSEICESELGTSETETGNEKLQAKVALYVK